MKSLRRLLVLLRADSPSLLVIGRLSATGLAFVTAPVVARTIGPAGRGETAAAIALFNIVPIVLAIGVPLEVRRQAAIGNADAALRSARILCLAALPLACAIAFVCYLTIFASFDVASRLAATFGVAVCPLMMSWTCDLSVLIASSQFRGVMALQLIQPGAYLIAILALALAGALTTSTVLLASVLGTFAAFVTGASLTRIPLTGGYMPMARLLRGGVRYAGSAIAETASSRLDQVLALPLIGAVQAGLYSVAVTVASIPIALGQAIGAVYFPLVARANLSDRPVLKEEAVRVASATSLMTAPLLFVAVGVGVPLLFGPEFIGAVPVAWISSVGTCALIVAFVCSMTLAAEGRGHQMTVSQVIALTIAMGLLFLLGPPFGALGAAVASSTAYIVLLVLLAFALRIRFTQALPRRGDFRLSLNRLFRSKRDNSGGSEPNETT